MRRSMRLALIVGAALMVMLLVPTVGAQEEVDGREVYLAECSACHQGTGRGVSGSFPPLAGNENVGDTAYVETVIVEGKTGAIEVLGVTYDGVMPAFPDLTAEEINAVIEYIQGGVFIPAETAGLSTASKSKLSVSTTMYVGHRPKMGLVAASRSRPLAVTKSLT